MRKGNVTIEGLARLQPAHHILPPSVGPMVKNGFDGTDKKIEKGFKEVNVRLDRIENLS